MPPTDKLQGSLLAQIAAERLEKESAAILFLNNAYGNGLSNGFTETFEEEYGGAVLNQVSYSAGRSSYTSQLQNVLDGAPQTLVIIGYPESGNNIFRNFYENFDRADMDILMPDRLSAADLPGNVGHDITNVRGTDPSSAGPGIEHSRSAYEDEYDSAPGPFNQQSFDAAAVLLLARAAASLNLLNGTAESAAENKISIVHQGEGQGSESLKFDHCIIATGSRPIETPGLDFDDERIVSSDGVLNFETILDELVIVGAGYIGMELATVYGRLGSDVSVIETL